MNALVSLLPLAVLIWLITKKRSVPSSRALPIAALLLYLVRLVWFRSDPVSVHAEVLNGLLTAWTPILIIWGAIVLFKTIEHSGAAETIRTWIRSNTENRVAQLMIVGWAFAFLVEGASGFGTPAALAAPLLVALGFPPVQAAIFCLVCNSVPVSFGAVGTPTWLGFSELGLPEETLLAIGQKTAIVHTIAALVIPVVALRLVVSWREIKKSLLFVYLSVAACVVPYLLLSRVDYEFPSIVGGGIGLVLSMVLARYGVGLPKEEGGKERVPLPRLLRATFPLWGTVLLLVVTRIRQIGVKPFLVATEPAWRVQLGSLGELSVSASLVLGLKNIFGTASSWSHKLLYVPSIVPFVVVSLCAFLWLGVRKTERRAVWRETAERVRNPIFALLGALVFVKLLLMDGEQSSAMIIGQTLAGLVGRQWRFAASYLGALGSFYAGSNTVSNLSFANIQANIAARLALDRETILALQSVGGAMGNMVCINNIVAVSTVLGLTRQEGSILKRTVLPMLLYGVIAGLAGLLL